MICQLLQLVCASLLKCNSVLSVMSHPKFLKMYFCFLSCSSPCCITSECFFVLTDPNYNTTPASEMNDNELEPEFLQTSLSVNPILITKSVQVRLLCISLGYKAISYLNVSTHMRMVLSIKFHFIFSSLQCSHETAY